MDCVFKVRFLRLFILFFLFLITSKSYAQVVQIKGQIVDTTEKRVIKDASIVLISSKDSFLVADTRSQENGSFLLSRIAEGNYTLLVTYPGYADYAEDLSVDKSWQVIDLNRVQLTLRAKLLEEVVIEGKRTAIRIKGDTTEYNASSYKVQPNASVEDLLKQLPGIQVSKDGQITARGKSIQKVLVDGEEFFGDDPTLVTRNLRADMVDKVQVYEKASDQEAFTGIKDGKRASTLDVKLKKDKKVGYFGKIELGAGTNHFYQNQAMFNSFKGNRKLAAYFTLSNTSLIGLDRRSQQNYAGGEGASISNELDNWNGKYNGVGIPKAISGGVHYDNKWNNDKYTLNANYKVGSLDVSGEQFTTIQNNLPQTFLNSETNQVTRNSTFRQGLDIASSIKIDSSSTLKLNVEGLMVHKKTRERYLYTSKSEKDIELSNSNRNVSTEGNINSFYGNALWLKKLKKERRTFSLNFNSRFNKNSANGFFYTQSNFLNSTGGLDSEQTVDQYKKTNNHQEVYGLRATYTEPLGKYNSLLANYGISSDNSQAELLSYNKGSEGYKMLDSTYSNIYHFNQLSNKGGLSIFHNKGKLRVQIGTDVAVNKFDQQNIFFKSTLKRSFVNWYPSAEFNYSFSSTRAFRAAYNGDTRQPTILQLVPITNNNDPLNEFQGNAYLKPAFSNSLSLSYRDFKFVSPTHYLEINADYSNVYNPITTSVITDQITGKNVYRYVNLVDKVNSTFNGNLLYSSEVKNWNANLGGSLSYNRANYANMTNGMINESHSNNYEALISISKMKESKYTAWLTFGPTYSNNKNSLQPLINNNYWGLKINPSLQIYLPAKFLLDMDCSYLWQGKTEIFAADFSRLIWNAKLEKKVLKNNDITLRLSARDILNQNTGFDRSVYNNQIIQNRYTTIARYFMISAIWDFNKSGSKTK